jgi:hypothetical protein
LRSHSSSGEVGEVECGKGREGKTAKGQFWWDEGVDGRVAAGRWQGQAGDDRGVGKWEEEAGVPGTDDDLPG